MSEARMSRSGRRLGSGRKVLRPLLTTATAVAVVAATTGATEERLEANPAFAAFTPEAVEHALQLARSAEEPSEPTTDDILSVLQFRHSCQVVASFIESRGAGDSRARLEALPGEAREIGQPYAAEFFADQIVPAAQAEEWERLESFVSSECDPNQDMTVPLRR